MSHVKAKDALDTIGTILTKDEGRDAVHVAVVCCKALHFLEPGQKVCLGLDMVAPGLRGVRRAGATDTVLGIVDPFLPKPVERGDLFWVFLTPRTITGLTHRWTHPAFPEEDK